MNILENLNPEQKKAAQKIDGPSLILAGAGSGKTRTVTYKIAYMIKELGINPNNILALTFTNKAANEMKQRVIDLVGEIAHTMTISTFHSFAVKLLRRYANNIGFANSFNIYDTDDSKSVIKKIMKEFNIDDGTTPSKYLNKISKLKETEILYDKLQEKMDLSIRSNRIFYDIYKTYQENLSKSNCMDFSDILINCKKILCIPEILEKVQEQYKYILVDEYQDTNNIQYNIVKLIASKYRNICVVGDEDQSIYAFRGADISNILNFENDYKDALVIKLEQNYRSTQNILNLANSVIKNNTSSKGKKLWSDNNKGSKIKVFNAETPYDEANFIAGIIRNSNKKFSDFTILYRTNFQSRILEQELTRYSIPCKVFGGLSFYQRKEIKDLLSYLTFIINPLDEVNFERCITNPKRKIGEKTIQKIKKIAVEHNTDLMSAMLYDNNSKIKEFHNIMSECISFSEKNSVSELLKFIINKISYFDYLKQIETSEERIANIKELINAVIEIENDIPDLTLEEYLTSISLANSSDDINDENYVKLMTIHSSKGLEFDTVFITGFETGIFPSNNTLDNITELEEERRLCYVAITRAKNDIYITHTQSRMVNGITQYNIIPSIFLREMDNSYLNFLNGTNNVKSLVQKEEKIKTTIENFNPFKFKNNTNYSVGSKVTHTLFGEGVIKQIDEKSLIIDFIAGQKKISLALADKFLKK